MNQSERLLDALKKVLKARRITYAQLAQGLQVSEPTVKRLFAQEQITLNRLEQICDFLGLEFADLANQIREGRMPQQLSLNQEAALAEEPRLLAFLQYLLNEWSVADMREKLDINDAECVRWLTTLDRLQIIKLFPGDKVRLNVARTINWRPTGPVRARHARRAVSEFMIHAFNGKNEAIRYAFREVSNATQEIMLRKLAKIAEEFDELADYDANLPAAERTSIGFLTAQRPWQFSIMEAIPHRDAVVTAPAIKNGKPKRAPGGLRKVLTRLVK
jgi:DNA-binding Xre family transcriptional regulator